jgi:hypothetical protein
MIHELVIPYTARAPSNYVAIIHEPVNPHTASTPRKYVAIFHEIFITFTARIPRKYVAKFRVHSSQLMPVLLATNWQCFIIPSSHVLIVILANM